MKNKKILLLSPHPDDVAFSIGGLVGLLSQTDADLLLVNAFTRTVYCLPTFKTDCINLQRKFEDKKYSNHFNLRKIDFELPDSSVLNHTAHSEIIYAPNDMRRPILKQKLNEFLNAEKPNIIFCPLAIGGHIDHRMLKEICSEISRDNYQDLLFYEDLPYACNYSPEDIEDIIRRTTNIKLYAQHINITHTWFAKKIGISFYESQVTDNIITIIHKYAQVLGLHNSLFERIWSSSIEHQFKLF